MSIMTKYTFDEGITEVIKRTEDLLLHAPGIISQYTGHLAESSGKLIRARALLACSLDQENLVNQDSIQLAASIELFHLATLVHDDIIDDADTRRGLPTLQKKFGKRTAVICGDYLLSISLQEASKIKMPAQEKQGEVHQQNLLLDYIQRVCIGELEQYQNNRNFGLSMLSYLRIIRGKTATLFEAAFRAGAYCAGADETLWQKYAKLGRFVGMIFQLSDDCIDYEFSADRAKKPVVKDFEEGVVTLPLIAALAKEPSAINKIATFLGNPEKLVNFVKKNGGTDYTRTISGKYFMKAEKIIDELSGTPEKIQLLKDILKLANAGSIMKERTC
jgi:heptaprenyl diphosphate synthase